MNKDTLISNPIQGYAVYLEFGRKDKRQTQQFLLTPDGFDVNNNFVPAYIYYRYLTNTIPRKHWKGYLLSDKETIIKSLDDDKSEINNFEEITEERLLRTFTNVVSRFTKNTVNDMDIVFSPIVVEVSKKDLTDIHRRTTPTKIIYRVQQVKKSVGFPETLQVA